MASHPYISGASNIAHMIGFLRKNFPPTVTSETVKKFSLAPNNESYVINALQFIGVIEEDGKRTEKGHEVFLLSNDAFPNAFGELVRNAYKDLFDIRGEDAWTLSRKDLTAYFRTTDKTSEVIGGRQAGVFEMFRTLAGYQSAEASAASPNKTAPKSTAKPKLAKPKTTAKNNGDLSGIVPPAANKNSGRKEMAMTVRIEINLPANGTQETYDNIFRSIRDNLINE